MIRLFRIGGIPVRLDAGWALILGVLAWSLASGSFPHVLPGPSVTAYWAGGLVAATLLFASIFLHELSHALLARVFGMHVAAITLHVFGGVSEMESEPPHPGAEVLIAVAGPLTSFAIAGAALGARHATGEAEWAAALLGYVGLVNAAIGLFNLVPGYPLDGGRILRALLWWWSGNADGATTVASRVGGVFALGLVALGLVRLYHRDTLGGIWFVVLGAFLFQAARASAEVVRVKRRLEGVTVDRVMTRAPITVSADAAVAGADFDAHTAASVPVVDGERFVGFLRRADAERRRWRDATAADVMVPPAADLVVTPDDSGWVALTRLARNRVGRVAVVEGDRIVGVVTRADLSRVLAEPENRRLDRVA